ncbi:hypothetical protein EYF80_024606 [Liparis tanakae]|uniref:Uncharacterized protein n=1 Tax=Liparis tanakae TaxID=230148 RepID=A0A4Z2HH48_9TELE|nr:hypothetical protein EYF80_024606 [Liparis tanakae]
MKATTCSSLKASLCFRAASSCSSPVFGWIILGMCEGGMDVPGSKSSEPTEQRRRQHAFYKLAVTYQDRLKDISGVQTRAEHLTEHCITEQKEEVMKGAKGPELGG